MIAKCKAISHGRAMLEYAMRDSKMDRIIARHLVSEITPAEVFGEFELVNRHNTRCKNKCLRFEIGVAPQDQEKLKTADLKGIAFKFAKKLGLDNHQWIAITHKDTRHMHIHLIANRIGVDGKVYDTDFVSNRSAKAAEDISREMGLTIAKEVRAQKEHIGRGDVEQAARAQKKCAAYFGQERLAAWGLDQDRLTVKAELQQLAYESLRNTKNPKDFADDLRPKGVRVQPVKNKQGKTYGLRFIYKGEEFKASEIGREFGLHSLYNHYGFKLEGQKGEPFIPQYISNPQPDKPAGSLANSITDTLKSGVGTAIDAVAEGGSIIGGLFDISPSNPDYDAEQVQIQNKPKKKKKKKQGRSIG